MTSRAASAAPTGLGLAYNVLNNAYDMSAYLKQHGEDAASFPWPFPTKNTSAAVEQFMGGGPEQQDLSTGDSVNVDVVNDAWHNTDLLSVQVAGCPEITFTLKGGPAARYR